MSKLRTTCPGGNGAAFSRKEGAAARFLRFAASLRRSGRADKAMSRGMMTGGRAFGRSERGSSAVEFALVATPLMLMIVGAVKFSLVMNQEISLNQGVASAVHVFSTCRNACDTTVGTANTPTAADAKGPWVSAQAALDSAAQALNSSTLNGTMTVTMVNTGGTNDGSCTDNLSCYTALTSDQGGGRVTVSVTYPCDLKVLNINFAPSCTLRAQTTAIIE